MRQYRVWVVLIFLASSPSSMSRPRKAVDMEKLTGPLLMLSPYFPGISEGSIIS